MAIEKITYANKSYGDLWRATEANHVKEVVNANADVLQGHDSSIKTINDTLDETLKQHKENTAKINTLVNSNVKQVFLTQAQYDELVSSGSIEADTMYNIYE